MSKFDDLKQAAQATALAEEAAAKGWLSRNMIPLIVGAVCGLLIGIALAKIF